MHLYAVLATNPMPTATYRIPVVFQDEDLLLSSWLRMLACVSERMGFLKGTKSLCCCPDFADHMFCPIRSGPRLTELVETVL